MEELTARVHTLGHDHTVLEKNCLRNFNEIEMLRRVNEHHQELISMLERRVRTLETIVDKIGVEHTL